MKFGVLFSFIGLLVLLLSVSFAQITSLGWALLWPAVSYLIAGSTYFFLGAGIYGKSSRGKIALFSFILMLPFLFSLWTLWQVLRIVKKENAFDRLTDKIFIGRRLLTSEFPSEFEHVIDLTCEFNEPAGPRSVDYHAVPILDGHVPSDESFLNGVELAANLPGTIYVHCAEGHGRAGMFCTALLVRLGKFSNIKDAFEFVKDKRPLVAIRAAQEGLLERIEKELALRAK